MFEIPLPTKPNLFHQHEDVVIINNVPAFKNTIQTSDTFQNKHISGEKMRKSKKNL